MSNNSSLPIYYTKETLSVRYGDYSNVYLLPTICAFGIVTSSLCIIVSAKRDESNAKSLDYIFVNSIIDLPFLLLQIFTLIIRCGALCPYGYSFGAKFYEIYFFQYAGYIFVTAQVFLSMYVSWDRLSMFSGKVSGKKKMSIFRVFTICLIMSAVANAVPYPIAKEVIPLGIYKPIANSSYYEVLYMRGFRKEFQSQVASLLLTIILAIKNPVLFCLLFLLNIWLCIKFRAYLQSRKRLIKKANSTLGDQSTFNSLSNLTTESQMKKSQQMDRKESNFTLLTLLYCLVYLIGNFIDSFAMMANIISFDIYVQYGYINIIGNSLFFGSHGVHLFLYYFFNNVFRKKFNEIFRIRQ